MTMNDAMMAKFAVAQAMYSRLGELVGRKGYDSLRSQLDDDIRATWETTGGTTYPIKVDGETVGSISVQTTEGYEVKNREQFEEWATNAGLADEVEYPNPDFDWQKWAMDDPQGYYEMRQRLREVPGFFARSIEIDPKWTEYVTHAGESVFDVETGEQLPFITHRVKFDGTRISGCKWEGGPKKYTPVADTAAIRNAMHGAPTIAGLLSDDQPRHDF